MRMKALHETERVLIEGKSMAMRGLTAAQIASITVLIAITVGGCAQSRPQVASSADRHKTSNDVVVAEPQPELQPVTIRIDDAGRNGAKDCVVWFRVSGSTSDENRAIARSVASHAQNTPTFYMKCQQPRDGECMLLWNRMHHVPDVIVVPEPDGSWLSKANVAMHDTPDPIVISMNAGAVARSLKIFHDQDFNFDEGEYLVRTGCSMLKVR